MVSFCEKAASNPFTISVSAANLPAPPLSKSTLLGSIPTMINCLSVLTINPSAMEMQFEVEFIENGACLDCWPRTPVWPNTIELLGAWEIVSFDTDRPVLQERNLQQFVDRLAIPEAIKGESEHPLLDVEAHQPMRHVETHQPGVHLLALEQRYEIRRVVRDEHVSVVDGAAHDRPILARAEPQPGDVRRFPVAA